MGVGGSRQQLDDEPVVVDQDLTQSSEVAKFLPRLLALHGDGDDARITDRVLATTLEALHRSSSFRGNQPRRPASPRNGIPPNRPRR